jgi:hypothetical protein
MRAAPLRKWAKQGDLHVLAHNACHQIGSHRSCWRHSEGLGRRRIGLYQVTSGIEVMASSLAPAIRLHLLLSSAARSWRGKGSRDANPFWPRSS